MDNSTKDSAAPAASEKPAVSLGSPRFLEEAHSHPQRKEVINRLARVEGHVRAVKRMAEEGRACTDLLVQLAAVRAAVEQVSRVVLADHVESCLRGAAASGAADEEWTRLKEALDRFIA
ncbi:MAG: metal-sensing transcriptional repressor [Chloroflexota bacterium]